MPERLLNEETLGSLVGVMSEARLRLVRALERLRARRLGLRKGVRVGAGSGVARGVRLSVADGGLLEIGDNAFVDTGATLHVGREGRLRIGDSCFVGHHSTVAAEQRVDIGIGSFLAELVSVRDHDHRVGLRPRDGGLVSAPVVIGADVWIGGKATVLRGVVIGNGAVIGAHASVRSDVPARHLAAGVPATVRGPVSPDDARADEL